MLDKKKVLIIFFIIFLFIITYISKYLTNVGDFFGLTGRPALLIGTIYKICTGDLSDFYELVGSIGESFLSESVLEKKMELLINERTKLESDLAEATAAKEYAESLLKGANINSNLLHFALGIVFVVALYGVYYYYFGNELENLLVPAFDVISQTDVSLVRSIAILTSTVNRLELDLQKVNSEIKDITNMLFILHSKKRDQEEWGF